MLVSCVASNTDLLVSIASYACKDLPVLLEDACKCGHDCVEAILSVSELFIAA